MTGAAFACPPGRIRDRELGDMPLDWGCGVAAARELDLRQLGAWQRLRMHLFKYGELPTGIKALATICGCGPRAFERMMPALAAHFDPDVDGRWTDRELIEARGDRPVLPQAVAAAPISEVRRRSGRAGADARWRKPTIELVSSNPTPVDVPDGGTAPMANSAAADGKTDLPGMANQGDADGKSGIVTCRFAMDLPSPSCGSIDRSVLESLEVELDLAPANVADEREGMAKHADPDGKTSAPEMAKSTSPDGKTALQSSVSATSLVAAAPALQATEPGSGFVAHDAVFIIARLRDACPGKIAPGLLTAEGIRPLWSVLGESADLRADLEVVVSCIVGLKDPIRSFTARWLHDEIRKARLARPPPDPSAPVGFKDPVLEAYRLVTEEIAGGPDG